ncbi:MAG: type II secretion system protein GspG [Acidobacteriota bacterium]
MHASQTPHQYPSDPHGGRPNRGFTLLELVIVVMIVGLITVIAVPNLLEALDRSRRSSTQADMRSIATALDRYAADHRGYPTAADLDELRPTFVPLYVKSLPIRDGWGHGLVYEVRDRGAGYTLRSPGKDGEFQTTADASAGYEADLVMVDGAFLEPSEPPGAAPSPEAAAADAPPSGAA